MGKGFKLPKTVGGWVGFTFKVMGAIVIAGPAISVAMADLPSGNYQKFPNDVLFAYTGLGGSTTWNGQQAAVGIGAIAGGSFLIFLGKQLGRMLR